MMVEILNNVRAVKPALVHVLYVDWSCRALCEHMNAHQNHEWRGMNPPPGVRLEELIEYGIK